jgi:hypothetical protein
MVFKTRPNIKKQFDTIADLGIDNLIVSGCSFTYNNHDSSAASWPYYLKDFGGFTQVLDCSLPGAGNQHISNSLLWALNVDQPDPKNSLIVVMWSGCDRDDYICPESNNSNTYPFKFSYSKNVISAITGGSRLESRGNTVAAFKEFSMTKTNESRAIENYLYIFNTWHCLKSLNYKFVFLNFLDGDLPSRTKHFSIKPYLPSKIQKNLDSMMTKITDPYTWALKNDLLAPDDFHPNVDGYLSWTKNVLFPYLKTLTP